MEILGYKVAIEFDEEVDNIEEVEKLFFNEFIIKELIECFDDKESDFETDFRIMGTTLTGCYAYYEDIEDLDKDELDEEEYEESLLELYNNYNEIIDIKEFYNKNKIKTPINFNSLEELSGYLTLEKLEK